VGDRIGREVFYQISLERVGWDVCLSFARKKKGSRRGEATWVRRGDNSAESLGGSARPRRVCSLAKRRQSRREKGGMWLGSERAKTRCVAADEEGGVV
jgi:hypothetical protein